MKALILLLLLPCAVFSQSDHNWRKLKGTDLVCMPTEDLHFIAAKRAAADDLSAERAHILVRQKNVIDTLLVTVDSLKSHVATMKRDKLADREFFSERYDLCVDANRKLQTKTARQQGVVRTLTIVCTVLGLGLIATTAQPF